MYQKSWITLSALGLALVACGDTASTTDASNVDAKPVDPPPTGDQTYKVVDAANALLAGLSATQRTAVQFDFGDDTQRKRWSNFPTGIFTRKGVRLGDMTTVQIELTYALLAATLSPAGFQQIVNTVDADQALLESSGGGNLKFGRAEYYVSILGTPSATTPWMFQFGGHHLAINATIVGKAITLVPSLTGAQPATFVLNGQTVRPQGVELDHAFAFVNSLDATQRGKAIKGSSFIDLVLGPGQDGRVLTAEGLNASELTSAQQDALFVLIADRAGILNDEDQALRQAELRTHLSETYVAWYGATTVGSPAYYRITGPTLAIEYSPQAMGGNGTDHTHAMYRDPTNDYGKALLQ